MPRPRSDLRRRPARKKTCIVCGVTKMVRTSFTSGRAQICKKCRGTTTKRQARLSYVGRTYNLSPVEYQALEAANDHCMACGLRADSYTLWSVDHDHLVEAELGVRYSVRGLICRSCNKILRDARDSALLLRRLADYLDEWPSARVLPFVYGKTIDRNAA